VAKRSSKHIKAQRDGKERDLYVCQICGATENVQGHHVFDVQYGGAADSENIITLCDEHHKKVHKGKISIIKF